jgi:Methyl-accepting chemotaxis protein
MNALKRIKKFLFDQKNTQALILRLSIIIPVLLITMLLLGIFAPTIFPIVSFILLIFLILISGFLLLLIIQFIKAIRLIDKNAITLSHGNLNISDIISEKTRGLEILASSFNDMKRNLLSYIESTKSNVIILSDAVDKVSKSIDMSYKGNEQIASNISIVAEKAQEQLVIAKDTLDGIEKVSLGASRITSTLGNIENFMEDTAKLTSEGASHVDTYTTQIQQISDSLDETSSFIQTLNSNLTQINQFGNLIMTIAGQLNLLSLNSRVEAARAGEAGKGFAVVAMEMDNLSTATKESITQINNLIGNISKSNAKVSESITNVANSFAMSKEVFNSVKESFYTINNNANILDADIKEVYEESVRISESTKEISNHGALLHDSSFEISSITEDVAAVTEEQLAENEEINEQAISLKRMLSSIENLLKRYKTSVLPVNKASEKRLRFVMLSPENDIFWNTVKQGSLYAQTELKDKNVDVNFIGFEKVDQTLIETLNNIINDGCDGLILPGFVKGIEESIQKAYDKKIPVMTFNCDIPDSTKRLSYFGPNIKAEGTLAAEILAKSIEEEGTVIIFRGNSNSSINSVRRDAAVAKLSKYSNIKIATEIDDLENPTQVYKKLKEVMYYMPKVDGILFIGDGAPGAAKLMEEMQLVGKTKLLCFNYNDDIADLVRKGIVQKVFRQDAFGQGHDPIIYLYNHLAANEQLESNTYTRTEVIDKFSLSDF